MNEHLYRSHDDRMLAGVAGGLAELWDADPSIVRVAWVLLTVLTGGIALVVYIVMAIVVPEEPFGAWAPGTPIAPLGPDAPVPGWVPPGAGPVATGPTAGTAGNTGMPDAWTARMASREARRAARAARRAARGDRWEGSAGLIVGGLLVAIGAAFFAREVIPSFDLDLFWPLILVGLGVVLLVGSVTRGAGAGPVHPS